MIRRLLPLIAALLAGCALDTSPLAVVHDAGVRATCGEPRPARGNAACYTATHAPARTEAIVRDPYPAAMGWLELVLSRRYLPAPPAIVGGVPVWVDPIQCPPAEPLSARAAGADRCLGPCVEDVGHTAWRWIALPERLAAGLYPYSPVMDSTCRLLPRPAPACRGVDPRRRLHVHLIEAMLRAGFRPIAGFDGPQVFLPDDAAVLAGQAALDGIGLLRLGRALMEACAAANTFTYDGDGDGAGDGCDVCVDVPDDQRDRDGDRLGDACDPCPDHPGGEGVQDADQDGIVDCRDVCPGVFDPLQRDLDGDGDGDLCDDDADDDGLLTAQERAIGTDPLDPDTDDDGRRDGADNCPRTPNPAQRDTDGDGEGDACADRDADGVLDRDDNCVAEPNADQADVDADGIGDACCGAEDPDDDTWSNCAWYPAGYLSARDVEPQPGAPQAVHDAWKDHPVPGEVSCVEGRRRCVPAGGVPSFTPGALEQAVLAHIAAGGPDVERVDRGSKDAALGICSARAEALPAPQVTPQWWAACLEDPSASPVDPLPVGAPVEVEFGGDPSIAVQFGLIGQRVVWWLGGFGFREGCRYDTEYEVLMPDGRARKGEMDFYCPSNVRRDADGRLTGRPGVLAEVKWWRTSITVWPDVRSASMIDQVERHFTHWLDEQAEDPTLRLIWIFGWNPPPTAEHILQKSPVYDFHRIIQRDPDELFYFPIPYVTPAVALADQQQADPWMAGPYYWTTFIPSDFRFIRGILDEAPCFPCSEHPGMCEAAALVDEWRQVTLHRPDCELRGTGLWCDFLDVEVTVLREGSVYVDQGALLRWLAIYSGACIQGRAEGCTPWLSQLYDRLKCRGLHPRSVLMVPLEEQL